MPRTKARKNANGATLGFEQTLWQAADKMRGHMDPLEYKHVVLSRVADAVGISPSPFARGTGEGAVACHRLFPDEFQDSPLGKIPKGWELKTFSEIVEINTSRPIEKGNATPYVDMASIPTSVSQVDALPESREYKSGSRFRNEDVLFARITPCLENGKTVLVDFLDEGGIGAGSTEFLVFGPGMAGTYFAYCASRSDALRNHAIVSMRGTSGLQRAQKGDFDHFEMAIPGGEIFHAFEDRVTVLFRAQRRSVLETATLSATRGFLLSKLLSGGIAVSHKGGHS